MKEIFSQYLDLLIQLKIYPFAPLEVNFVINFFWVLLKNIFKTSSDYRLGEEVVTFVEFKVLTFIFSFLLMFMFYLSFDFWSTWLDLNSNYLLFLPSLAAIVLAEISSLIVKFSHNKNQEIDLNSSLQEEKLNKEKNELSVYALISIVLLLGFWGYMIVNYFNKT